MMSLSCKAVGGQPEETYEAALAMSLINLSFYIWDDIIDKAPLKLFKPTVFGKFGEGTALIIGGLASAKAFSVLNKLDVEKEKHKIITKLFWDFLVKMANAETVNLRLRRQNKSSAKEKYWKIKTEAADLETCLRVGAILGNGSESEVKHLGRYGLCLGMILELWKDFHVSVNLTLELGEKIRKGALPYSLLWAIERSEKIRQKLEKIVSKGTPDQPYIKEIVEDILETKVLDHTLKTIRRFTGRAKKELSEIRNKNIAAETLEFFVEAQPRVFTEDLFTLQT
jgi:geranylgeranyl pyrophosphate synthase